MINMQIYPSTNSAKCQQSYLHVILVCIFKVNTFFSIMDYTCLYKIYTGWHHSCKCLNIEVFARTFDSYGFVPNSSGGVWLKKR